MPSLGLPSDALMERNTLGAALHAEQWLNDVVSVLRSAEDFYNPLHRDIYQAMLELMRANKPVDAVTVSAALQQHAQFTNAGGVLYLARLKDETVFPGRAAVYAREVRNAALLRRVMRFSDELKARCAEAGARAQDVLGEACKTLFRLDERTLSGSLELIEPILERTIDQMEQDLKSDASSHRVKTGFPSFDRVMGGLAGGTLNILAARPGMGKSTFALNIAHNAAMFYGKNVAIFSLEMSKEELAKRFMSARARINSKNFQAPNLMTKLDWAKLVEVVGAFKSKPIYIDDSAELSPHEMLARCRQLKSNSGLDLVIVDYLQLMTLKGKKENRQQEISEISRTLKLLAKELNVPVIALSQLRREAERGEEGSEPKLSDLRESGSLEQDADSVWMLYQGSKSSEEQEENPDEPRSVNLHIAKNRSGPTRHLRLNWLGQYTLFLDLPKHGDLDYEPPVQYTGAARAAGPRPTARGPEPEPPPAEAESVYAGGADLLPSIDFAPGADWDEGEAARADFDAGSADEPPAF